MSELRKGATTKWLTEFTCLPCLKIPACISIWQIINNYSKLNLGSGHLAGNEVNIKTKIRIVQKQAIITVDSKLMTAGLPSQNLPK